MPECLLIVLGMDARCPLCRRIVVSGTRHECDGATATNEPLVLRKPVASIGPNPAKKNGIR